MFHNCRYLVIAVCAGILSIAGAAPQYSLNSITDYEALISVEYQPGSCNAAQPFYIAFSSMPGMTVSARITHENGQAFNLDNQAAGWAGNDYLQWCSIQPSSIPCSDTTVHALITISFTEPVYRGISRRDAVCSNGIFRLPVTSKHLGKTSAQVNKLPYSSGLRMEIESDGVYELSYDLLKEHGVPVGNIKSRTYRLFERGQEIPLYITNEQHASLLRDDRIIFYGKKLRTAGERFESYSETNVYWLTWGGAAGARVAEVSGARRVDPTIYTTKKLKYARSYTDTLHIEYDNTLVWLGNVQDRPPEEITGMSGNDTSEVDNWYWGFVGLQELTSFTFDVPSPEVRGTARISIGIMGLSNIDSIANDHDIDVFLNDQPASQKNRISWDGQRYTGFESDTFSTGLLVHGRNRITLQTGKTAGTDRSALDWIKIVYTRNYESLGNAARFENTADSYGRLTEYTISGFGSDDIELWDITHGRFFTGLLVEKGTGNLRSTRNLKFQDSTGNAVQYYAGVKENRMVPAVMHCDTMAAGWDTLADCDYFAIAPDSFKTELEPLLDVHRRNGRRTAFVGIEDIYNKFSYGIRDPESIRLFMKFVFGNTGRKATRFVLLGGDATHNLDKKNADRTIVPVHLSRMRGWGPGADDGYFSTVNDDDQFPDCCIGRFPAQNRREMRNLVQKTVRFITEPDYGYWRDNLLLLGGGEAAFTEFNDMVVTDVIGTQMHIARMDADPASVYYKDGFVAPKRIADHLNTGMSIINFNGHGGGNIWSDNDFFGYNDLSLLHNGQWKGGRLPIVLSFTCLTGFFESTDYRSLGEEFMRVENDGAIAFYGASAYTSRNGNMVMDRLFLDEAVNGNHATVGELVCNCEMNMLVRYRTHYIDLVRQYNLLGDPALPLYRVADTMRLSHSINASVDSLHVNGNTAPVQEGKARVSLVDGYTTLDQIVCTVEKSNFSCTFPLKEGMKSTIATVRAYAWNDSAGVKAHLPFTKDTLAVTGVVSSPSRPFFNDSIHIFCTIAPIPDFSGGEVYCMYALTGESIAQAAYTGIAMRQLENGQWRSAGKIFLDYHDDINDRLSIFFRAVGSGGSLQSPVTTITVSGRPDCVVNGDKLLIQWSNDSLQLPFEIQNIGNAAAPPLRVALVWNRENLSNDTIAVLQSPDTLAPGERCKFTVALADTMGDLSYSVYVDPANEVYEILEDNNRLDGKCRIVYRDMQTSADTIQVNATTVIVPAHPFARKHRFFIFEDTIAASAPLATASVWRSLKGTVPVRWMVEGRPPAASEDSLNWVYNLSPALIADTALRKTAIMVFDTVIDKWRYGAGQVHGKSNRLIVTNATNGWCAIASLADLQLPEIVVSVYGKSLASIDYAAKDRPFSIFLSDPSSVLPQSVELYLNKKKMSPELCSELPISGDLRSITMAAYPKVENRLDSLTIKCSDLAGNSVRRTFAYLPGSDLSIKSFTCHPNPFTARKNGDGTISKIRFAFLLTDVAKNATLSIFTVSGKKIRTWSQNELIGYQQIEWDGRDYEGYRIANGTYYAKLFVKNDRKKDTKIIRIAKLEGF